MSHLVAGKLEPFGETETFLMAIRIVLLKFMEGGEGITPMNATSQQENGCGHMTWQIIRYSQHEPFWCMLTFFKESSDFHGRWKLWSVVIKVDSQSEGSNTRAFKRDRRHNMHEERQSFSKN